MSEIIFIVACIGVVFLLAMQRSRLWVWAAALTVATWMIWHGVADGSYFYFVHSYYARPADARHSVGDADYGTRFTAAIARDNIFATQFHPEKSADQGLALYRNFLHWNP